MNCTSLPVVLATLKWPNVVSPLMALATAQAASSITWTLPSVALTAPLLAQSPARLMAPPVPKASVPVAPTVTLRTPVRLPPARS